jgi:hypothetical protein
MGKEALTLFPSLAQYSDMALLAQNAITFNGDESDYADYVKELKQHRCID